MGFCIFLGLLGFGEAAICLPSPDFWCRERVSLYTGVFLGLGRLNK